MLFYKISLMLFLAQLINSSNPSTIVQTVKTNIKPNDTACILHDFESMILNEDRNLYIDSLYFNMFKLGLKSGLLFNHAIIAAKTKANSIYTEAYNQGYNLGVRHSNCKNCKLFINDSEINEDLIKEIIVD